MSNDDYKAQKADVSNLVDTWLETALDEIEEKGDISLMTKAALFGARLRSRELFIDDRWDDIMFNRVPHHDDWPYDVYGAKVQQVQLHVEAGLEDLKEKFNRMSEKCREFFHKMPHSWEPELDKYRDLSVQAVDLLDFISRVNIFLTWLTKEPGQVQSESIEKTWNWLETEIDSCEYLFLADYRINAIRNTVAEGVLASSDVLRSIRQRRTLSSLIPHHRAARRSAMAIAMASAVVHQYQVDIEDLE